MRAPALYPAVVAVALACAAFAGAHDGPHAARATAAALSIAQGIGYRVPDVTLIDARGRAMPLSEPFATSDPLLLNFVFTTCSTICSTQTATLAELQRRLLASGRRARFVTVTIDPANDTPARLAAFARQFDIRRDWSFLTGEYDELVRVQQAFDVYRGAKAAHPPVVLVRPARDSGWVRVEGIAAPADLLALLSRPTGRP
jgi:protein SCO1/2